MRYLFARRSRVVEGDLEGQGDEGVEERHGEVGGHSGKPAVDDELVEVERRVAGGDEELHVGGHVEGEGEEGDDDQVYQTDGDGGKSDRRVEGSEVEDREADCWRQGLRGGLEIRNGDAAVVQYLLRPLGAELCRDDGSE